MFTNGLIVNPDRYCFSKVRKYVDSLLNTKFLLSLIFISLYDTRCMWNYCIPISRTYHFEGFYIHGFKCYFTLSFLILNKKIIPAFFVKLIQEGVTLVPVRSLHCVKKKPEEEISGVGWQSKVPVDTCLETLEA